MACVVQVCEGGQKEHAIDSVEGAVHAARTLVQLPDTSGMSWAPWRGRGQGGEISGQIPGCSLCSASCWVLRSGAGWGGGGFQAQRHARGLISWSSWMKYGIRFVVTGPACRQTNRNRDLTPTSRAVPKPDGPGTWPMPYLADAS